MTSADSYRCECETYLIAQKVHREKLFDKWEMHRTVMSKTDCKLHIGVTLI